MSPFREFKRGLIRQALTIANNGQEPSEEEVSDAEVVVAGITTVLSVTTLVGLLMGDRNKNV